MFAAQTLASQDVERKPCVLIVEDEPSLSRMLETLLRRDGFVLRTAASGAEALALLQDELPDLVLSDLAMPGMSGLQLLRTVRELPATRHLPFVLLSGSGDTADKVDSFEAGANDYILKPFDRAELTARLLLQIRHARELERLRAEARNDELTGVYNRRGAMEALRRELYRVARDHATLALLVIDVDKFKDINDTHGHAAGDQVLCAIADTLGATVRTTDVVGRLGGDEFVVVLPAVDAAAAATVAGRIRASLCQLVVPGTEHAVSVSIGISMSDPTTPPEQLIRRADMQMYRDKRRQHTAAGTGTIAVVD